MDAVIPLALTAYHIRTIKSCSGTLCIDILFAADQYVMLGPHVFTEMKLRFTVKQKECGFYFSLMHHVRVVPYNFHSRFV